MRQPAGRTSRRRPPGGPIATQSRPATERGEAPGCALANSPIDLMCETSQFLPRRNTQWRCGQIITCMPTTVSHDSEKSITRSAGREFLTGLSTYSRTGFSEAMVRRHAMAWCHNMRNNQGYSGVYGWKPALSMPRRASGFFMNMSQTNPVRAFSAIRMVIPVSMPTTSVSYHFLSGLNASTNP